MEDDELYAGDSGSDDIYGLESTDRLIGAAGDEGYVTDPKLLVSLNAPPPLQRQPLSDKVMSLTPICLKVEVDPEAGCRRRSSHAMARIRREAPPAVVGTVTGMGTGGALGAMGANPLTVLGGGILGGGWALMVRNTYKANFLRTSSTTCRQRSGESWWARAGRYGGQLLGFRPGAAAVGAEFVGAGIWR